MKLREDNRAGKEAEDKESEKRVIEGKKIEGKDRKEMEMRMKE